MATEPYHGRLELTWTNKDRALLAPEEGGYEWVPPADYRVAEVRLLQPMAAVGEPVEDSTGSGENLLVEGDALNALTALARLPQFAAKYAGKVRLAYLDPPFNTQQAFEQYDDALEHSVWLTMMRDRLVQVRTLLARNGSVWVHLDEAEMAYCKVMMDEIFGRRNFVATVVWQKVYAPRNDAKTFSIDHDYILVYTRDRDAATFNKLERTVAQDALFTNPDDDPLGPWQSDNMTVNKTAEERPNLAYDVTDPETGRAYPYNPNRVWGYERVRMDRLITERRILWPASPEGRPRIKRYLFEVSQGRVPQTWWTYQEVGHNQDARRELAALLPDGAQFATPKPERLLQRVIEIGSDPGDLVLDPFLGSGTTAAVAHKMSRRWVGIERNAKILDTFAIPRLSKVVSGEDRGGISASAAWTGGGGFRVLDVGPSMFEDDEGVVVLADWATNGALAEATAAQLGFLYQLDPPFCGAQGRTRLAVIDGLVTPTVIKLLLGGLAEDELLAVCGTSLDDEVAVALRELRPGSRAQKVPASLLREYEQSIGRRSLWAAESEEAAPAPDDDATALCEPPSEGVHAAG